MVENITLLNTVTNASLELDKVTTPYYVLDDVDWGQVKSTHHQYKYVNQVGVYITGTSLETRDVSVTGWIIASSEQQMTSRKKILNRFVNPQQPVTLYYKSYKITFNPNGSVKYGVSYAENNDVICKFMIEGLCSDPMFSSKNPDKVAAATTKPMFHFPLTLNKSTQNKPQAIFGVRQPSLIIDIYNRGDVPTGMKIVFKAQGTVTCPRLVNVQTQEFFKVNKTLSAGETVEVNTNIGSKKIIGKVDTSNEETNYFKYRDLDSTWLQLNVGDNILRYDADSGIDNLEVYVYFSNKYLEVQECF